MVAGPLAVLVSVFTCAFTPAVIAKQNVVTATRLYTACVLGKFIVVHSIIQEYFARLPTHRLTSSGVLTHGRCTAVVRSPRSKTDSKSPGLPTAPQWDSAR